MDSTYEQLSLETPENIRFDYDVADIGSRFLAISIDTLIQGVMYFILFVGIAVLMPRLTDASLPRIVNDSLVVLLVLVLFLIQFGYFLFLEIIMNGQTPGKRLFRLRVVSEAGYPLSPLGSIIRNIVRIIDFFPLFYGIGIIVMFFNRRARRLGDLAAGTLVVKMRDEVRLQSLLPIASAPAPEAVRLQSSGARLDEADIALAESFLRRSSQLSNKDALALEIAQRLSSKLQLPAEATPNSPERAHEFLRQTVTTYRTPRPL
jgi:uncharacterized RDD family membrane protein YckC